LQHDAQAHGRGLAQFDHSDCLGRRPLDRLLHQDVLSRPRQTVHELHPCIGRREQDNGVDGRIGGDRVETLAHGKPIGIGGLAPPCLARAPHGGNDRLA
jgi:hypothetical protein